jgi:hypothetical protein
MTTPDLPKLSLRSQTDVLAAIPYLVGWIPNDSLICLAIDGNRLVLSSRIDLPSAGPVPADVLAAVDLIADRTAEHATSATLVGYGQPDRVGPIMDHALSALRQRAVPVGEALRLTGDRYFCYLCQDCIPDGGALFNPDASTAPATAVYDGMVALPDRDALVEQIATVEGRERRWMDDATQQAWTRLRVSVPMTDAAGAPLPPHILVPNTAQVVTRLGIAAVREAFAASESGQRLSDAQAAWISVLLMALPVRDYAWQLTNDSDGHGLLWTDLTRRARPDLAAGPACLLAYHAMLRGNGGLANIALQRAIDTDPDYSMAQLLRVAINTGLPPDVLRAVLAHGSDDEPYPSGN